MTFWHQHIWGMAGIWTGIWVGTGLFSRLKDNLLAASLLGVLLFTLSWKFLPFAYQWPYTTYDDLLGYLAALVYYAFSVCGYWLLWKVCESLWKARRQQKRMV